VEREVAELQRLLDSLFPYFIRLLLNEVGRKDIEMDTAIKMTIFFNELKG
jgi:two-component sensor histidine kinase